MAISTFNTTQSQCPLTWVVCDLPGITAMEVGLPDKFARRHSLVVAFGQTYKIN